MSGRSGPGGRQLKLAIKSMKIQNKGDNGGDLNADNEVRRKTGQA